MTVREKSLYKFLLQIGHIDNIDQIRGIRITPPDELLIPTTHEAGKDDELVIEYDLNTPEGLAKIRKVYVKYRYDDVHWRFAIKEEAQIELYPKAEPFQKGN